MTIQDTLGQLNAARDQLTDYIIANNAAPGTPEWTKLKSIIEQREELSAQIDAIIAAQFNIGSPALTAAMADVQQATQRLTNLQKTLSTIDQVISATDAVVQAATAIAELAAAV